MNPQRKCPSRSRSLLRGGQGWREKEKTKGVLGPLDYPELSSSFQQMGDTQVSEQTTAKGGRKLIIQLLKTQQTGSGRERSESAGHWESARGTQSSREGVPGAPPPRALSRRPAQEDKAPDPLRWGRVEVKAAAGASHRFQKGLFAALLLQRQLLSC